MELRNIATDNKKLQEGTWVPISEDGGEVLVVSSLSPRWRKGLRKAAKLFRGANDEDGTLENRMLAEQIIEGGLLDWRGIKLDGKDVPFSKEKAREILVDYPILTGIIAGAIDNLDNFRPVEEAAKNSEPASAGDSSTSSGEQAAS